MAKARRTRSGVKKKSAKKAAGKSAAAKRPATKRAGATRGRKKSAAKKAPAKGRVAAKTATSKKKPAKKAAVKKKAVKKKTAKKRAARKVVAKKATAKKKVLAKKTAAKRRATAKKATRKASAKKATKKAPAKKVAKKAPAKKVTKKAPAKKVAQKAPAKKVTKKAPAKKVTKKAPAKKVPPKKAPKGAKGAAGKQAGAAGARPREAAETAPRAPRVELAPRSSVVAPSIPIPVKKVPRKPTLEERARKARRRINRQSAEFRARYDDNFAMSWIYHDSALEGVVYTFEELTAAFCSDEVTVVDSSVMPIYDAIRRHRQAIDFVRAAADKKRTVVNVDFLKELYVILHPEAGDTKSIKYRRDTPQHRLYFHEYAPPDKIAYRVRQIIEWVNSPAAKKSAGALRAAARAHYDLARTYPFPHDSGKVARLFMNFLLMRGGLPPAIVHATERQRYYEALKTTSAANLVKMLRDSVANALSSIEKLLDEHETRTRGFHS